jgi:hypothetical protein
MLVVFGLNHGQGQVELVVQNEIGAASFATRVQLAAHHDAALGEAELFADLLLDVPPSPFNRGGDELGTDVPFSE